MPIHITPISRRRFLAGSLATGAGMLFAEIDPSVIAAVRKDNPVLADRRPDLYGAAVEI